MTKVDNDPSPPPYILVSGNQMPKPPKNVILFGETGAGKSAVVNLIAGAEVASVSADTRACTLQATKYTLTLGEKDVKDGLSFNVWDTVGLEDNEDPLKAIENAHTLITDLHDAGGVDLLLFCIRGGRVTAPMQRHYRLFVEFLCANRVPLAIVVTHLEGEKVMEDWWDRNHQTLAEYGMNSIQHACITAAPTHLRVHASKRAGSQTRLKNMLHEVLSVDRPAYKQDIKNWFLALLVMLFDFLKSGFGFFKKRTLVGKLESRCGFSRQEAQTVANMILTSMKEKCK